MDFLVTMTTRVPEGTSDDAINEVRSREAARSGQLAADGSLLRLWRPPLAPGEWRTLGLFAAANAGALEAVLESMPLRVWRSDEVTALASHPNDPGPRLRSSRHEEEGTELLITLTVTVPPGTPRSVVDDTYAREAQRAHHLAEEGHLRRLWTLPDDRVLGLWWAADRNELDELLPSLPVAPWMAVETLPLTPHPSDPALHRP
jgi:muconolactone delta-isomerase